MPTQRHTHTYVRLVKSSSYKNSIYRCFDPHCTHKIEGRELLGKAALCNLCGSEFVLTAEDLKRSKPRCLECSDTSVAKTRRKANEAASGILKSLKIDTQWSKEQ